MYVVKRLFTSVSQNKKLIPNCRACKHYCQNNNGMELCKAFILSSSNNYTDDKFYYMCSSSREKEDMCGIEGKKYIRAYNHITHNNYKYIATFQGIASLGFGYMTFNTCHGGLFLIFTWISGMSLGFCVNKLETAYNYGKKEDIPEFIAHKI